MIQKLRGIATWSQVHHIGPRIDTCRTNMPWNYSRRNVHLCGRSESIPLRANVSTANAWGMET
jgi:hypothetical protein